MAEASLDDLILQILVSRAGGQRRQKQKYSPEKVVSVCSRVTDILRKEKILLYVHGDYTIVGDIHGNIDDLIRIFKTRGYPPDTNYIFLGDYVDRGYNSIDVMLLLFSLKLKYPKNMILLRGNHESPSMTANYGFHIECKRFLNKICYQKFLNAFEQLPVACVLNKKVLCLHGGISPSLKKVEDLLLEPKTRNIPFSGVVADILWSDPDSSVRNFVESDRQVGYIFGAKPLIDFLDRNGLQMLVRSHESCDDGFDYPFKLSEPDTERILTIFSTSDYCDGDNKSAVLSYPEDGEMEIVVFEPFSSLAEKQKRSVVLPEWLLEIGDVTVSPPPSDAGLSLIEPLTA